MGENVVHAPPGENHFTIIAPLADPDSALVRRAGESLPRELPPENDPLCRVVPRAAHGARAYRMRREHARCAARHRVGRVRGGDVDRAARRL